MTGPPQRVESPLRHASYGGIALGSATLLIGLGKGGSALMPYLMSHPEFDLVGVCDSSPEAVGRIMAERLRIPFYQDAVEAVKVVKPQLVIDASGDPSLPDALYGVRPAGTSLVTGDASRLLWMLLAALEARRRWEIRHDRLLGDMMAGMLVVQDERVRFSNSAFLKMLGYTSEHVLGRRYADLVTADLRDRDLGYYHERLAGRQAPGQYDTKMVHADGSLREVVVRARLSDYDGRPASLVVLIDVTELRHLQRERERFFRFMVHELRAPLSPLVTAVSLLRKPEVMKSPEHLERLLPLIGRSTDRLQTFVDDFLELSRLDQEAMRVTQEDVDLKAVIDEVVENQRLLAEEKGLDLKVEPWPAFAVRGDAVVIRTLVQNLVNNAIKYTDKGSVAVAVDRQRDVFGVRVADTGVGLTDEERQGLFQEFGRIQRSAGVKGTGLGLAITKRLVEACGGRVTAESQGKGRGSTFAFWLPYVFGTAEAAEAAEA